MRALLLALLLSGGCAEEQRLVANDGRTPPERLQTGEKQRERLCGRQNSDVVVDLFCKDSPPTIRGIVELREALALGTEVDLLDRGFVLNGHSTSLVSRSVSAINPRIIFVRFTAATDDIVGMAFARGEGFTEIVVRDRVNGLLQFYLVVFSLPCDDSPEGCSPGDLLTEATESGWTSVDVYGEEDLLNSPLDCRVCHQPEGPGTPKILRMQELEPPWNHWLYRLSKGGDALLSDYYSAKGDESFVGVPGNAIKHSQPGLLSFTIFATSPPQPNLFVSRTIQDEVVRSAAERGGMQPADNSVPGESETWEAIYERAKRGDAISVPYHDVKVTDADKLERMAQAYTDYRQGDLAREDLPDIRDVYPSDPQRLARIGLVTEPDLSGEEVLLQACGQCHNQRMDQSLSRARFDVDLSLVDRQERDRAMARVQLPIDDPEVMPPALLRRLSDQGRMRLLELLAR